MLYAAGASVRGPSHVLNGEPNQDSLGIWGHKRGWIAVVADGLGSRPMSHVGSRSACMAARRVVRSGDSLEEPKQLMGNIYRSWLASLPIPPSSAATTFLTAIADSTGRVVLAQLGDGLVLYRSNRSFGILTPERKGFSDQTNGLGFSRSWGDWQSSTIMLKAPGDGVMLMTDGISDDLNQDALEKFFQKMQKELSRRSSRNVKRWISAQLEQWPTPGHSDDKTIAMIWRDSK